MSLRCRKVQHNNVEKGAKQPYKGGKNLDLNLAELHSESKSDSERLEHQYGACILPAQLGRCLQWFAKGGGARYPYPKQVWTPSGA